KKHLVTNDGIMGAPDLVVEIISPNSVKRDRVDKMKLYKKYQIRECWLIDPNNRSVEVYTFQESEKDYDIFSFAVTDGTVQSQVLAGFSVEIAPLFV
ncbi:MAG: Uma2 family endonuclease, partial [Cytophagales bacterium]|nr:Uma2 family endonuclease [Cytophagales bacterium]